ncbi:MAG TPA: hypothetical protein VFR81_17190 [Longimicrobium sp.]|nr:hypothetical protein [Longimicrobium sp.]
MALRTFTDSQGTRWDVWNVTSYVLRGQERRADGDDAAPEYEGTERRGGTRDSLVANPAAGWLCFQSESEKRRLTPVPAAWVSASDAELEALLAGSVPVGRRPPPR